MRRFEIIQICFAAAGDDWTEKQKYLQAQPVIVIWLARWHSTRCLLVSIRRNLRRHCFWDFDQQLYLFLNWNRKQQITKPSQTVYFKVLSFLSNQLLLLIHFICFRDSRVQFRFVSRWFCCTFYFFFIFIQQFVFHTQWHENAKNRWIKTNYQWVLCVWVSAGFNNDEN